MEISLFLISRNISKEKNLTEMSRYKYVNCRLIDKTVNNLFARYRREKMKNKRNFITTKKGQRDMVKSGREKNPGIRAKKFDKAHVLELLL